MNQKEYELLKQGHAEIKIVCKNDFMVDTKADGNGSGLMLSTLALIGCVAEEFNLTFEEVMISIMNLKESTNLIQCESKEQRDVMHEIIKNKNQEQKNER